MSAANLYGIYAWFGYLLPLEKRLAMIKNAGFSSVMLWWGDEFESLDGKKINHPDLARKHGLSVENAHAPYQFSNDLWSEKIDGDGFEKLISGCIKDCKRCSIKTLVMHITDGKSAPAPSETGLSRMFRLLATAAKNDVTLAIENVRQEEHLDFVFSNISSSNLGFCYDSGHEFAVSGKLRLLKKYGDKLCALHLHDNNGKSDQHLIPGEGRLDFRKISSLIKTAGYKGPLTLESCAPWREGMNECDREPPEHYLKRAYDALEKIAHGGSMNAKEFERA